MSQAGIWGRVPEELELGHVCRTPRKSVWLEWRIEAKCGTRDFLDHTGSLQMPLTSQESSE